MRRTTALAALSAGALTLLVAPAPAGAAPGFPVHIVAHTAFVGDSVFDTSLAECSTGTVTDQGAKVTFTPRGGTFMGDKVFACAGGSGGFTLRLKARFGEGGSTGSWVVGWYWTERFPWLPPRSRKSGARSPLSAAIVSTRRATT